jgi:hypothetical protein
MKILFYFSGKWDVGFGGLSVFLIIWSELTVQCVRNSCLFTGKVNLAHYLWTLLLELDQLNYMRQIGTAKRLDKTAALMPTLLMSAMQQSAWHDRTPRMGQFQ